MVEHQRRRTEVVEVDRNECREDRRKVQDGRDIDMLGWARVGKDARGPSWVISVVPVERCVGGTVLKPWVDVIVPDLDPSTVAPPRASNCLNSALNAVSAFSWPCF